MPADTYFVSWKGRRDGPYSVEQLADLLQRGEVSLLHRVETNQGSVPLRQLLQNADGGRWGHLLNAISAPTPAAVAEGTGAATATLSPNTPPVTATARPAGVSPLLIEFLGSDPADPAFASRAYALCGLSFIFPPLGWFVAQLASTLVVRGCVELGRRVRLLALSLALTGCFFWGLLLKFL